MLHHSAKLYLREVLSGGGDLRMIERCVGIPERRACTAERERELCAGWDEVVLEGALGEVRPDVSLRRAGVDVALLEVYVRHAVEAGKGEALRTAGIPWTEVDARWVLGIDPDGPLWTPAVPLQVRTWGPGRWTCEACEAWRRAQEEAERRAAAAAEKREAELQRRMDAREEAQKAAQARMLELVRAREAERRREAVRRARGVRWGCALDYYSVHGSWYRRYHVYLWAWEEAGEIHAGLVKCREGGEAETDWLGGVGVRGGAREEVLARLKAAFSGMIREMERYGDRVERSRWMDPERLQGGLGPRRHNWNGEAWVPRHPRVPPLVFPPPPEPPMSYQAPIAGRNEPVPVAGWTREVEIGRVRPAPRAVLWVRAKLSVDTEGRWLVVGGWDNVTSRVVERGWDPLRLRDRVESYLITEMEQRWRASVFTVSPWVEREEAGSS